MFLGGLAPGSGDVFQEAERLVIALHEQITNKAHPAKNSQHQKKEYRMRGVGSILTINTSIHAKYRQERLARTHAVF